MNWTSLTMLLGSDARWINFDQRAAAHRRQRGWRFRGFVRLLGPPRPHVANNFRDFVILATEQMLLTDQCVLDFAGELEPRLAWPWAQVAERSPRKKWKLG